jgi:Uncharacterised protein conserved in bacteria (DUF2336)
MMPEEWPIAGRAEEENAPARAAGRGRLSTVRLDFFLNPSERLTEQERALMTAMLRCLVGDIATEIRAGLPLSWAGANDDDAAIIGTLSRAGLLNDADLMAMLLRRADEERIGTAARARSGRNEARTVQGLVSHQDGAVSAAAMALILVRGRRRDRFGQCLVGFDDLSSETAERLAYATAAALRHDVASSRTAAAADAELTRAARRLVEKHEPSRSVEALTGALVALLEEADSLSDDLLLACAREGEVALLAKVIDTRGSIGGSAALDGLMSGEPASVMALMRVAGFSRELSAGLLANLGDLLGIEDEGAAINLFDEMSPGEVEVITSWLTMPHSYRAALEALGEPHG